MTKQNDSTQALLRQLMRDRSQQSIDHLFAPGHVRVILGQDVAPLPQAQILFSFAVNLISRLHPVVQKLDVIVPPDVNSEVIFARWHSQLLHEHLANLLNELNPPVLWSLDADKASGSPVELIVGDAEARDGHCIYVGSNGWEVEISNSPVSTISLLNPIGAYAAACIAVGEVWKRLLIPHRDLFPGKPIVPIDKPLKFSCFTYKTDASGQENPLLKRETDLGRITLVGLGAGGGALAFSLASLPKVRGTISLIEPDEVNLPNLNRYVFASEVDAARRGPGRLKTDVVASLFARYHDVIVKPYPKAFSEVYEQLTIDDFRYVVAAVHSRAARREIQYETPEILWDGGATEDGDFRIWRIQFGQTECMFCKHPVIDGDPEEDEAFQLSEVLGLSQKLWLEKIRNNSTFSPGEIEKLSLRREEKGLDFDLPEPDERYSDWFKKQCGSLQLPERDQEVPIPFAPVMAGVLLAGEIIKERQFPEAVLPHYYGNTLVGSWMRKVVGQPRPPKPECKFCNDKVYRAQFEGRWRRS